jgi:hypothetical protein
MPQRGFLVWIVTSLILQFVLHFDRRLRRKKNSAADVDGAEA